MMCSSRATGFVIFRRSQKNQVIEYLLLKASYGTKHWTPPKGHVDPGENDLQTALRETEEEAGLKKEQLNIFKDFQVELNYEVMGRGKNQGKMIPKTVIYYLAELIDPVNNQVKLSDEHTEYVWESLDKACEIAGFEDMKQTLKKCEVEINKRNV